MGGTGNNDVQVFDTANEAAGWLELSSIADPIPETYAGGSQYLAATNDGAVYTVSAFVKKVASSSLDPSTNTVHVGLPLVS